MKLIYIAGPFAAKTRWKQEQQIREAEEVALMVAEYGHVPVCPHTMYRFFDGTCSVSFWYRATMELLERCDAIVMIDGWKDSTGAVDEQGWAEENKMPICDLEEEAFADFVDRLELEA